MSKIENVGRSVATSAVMTLALATGGCDGQAGSGEEGATYVEPSDAIEVIHGADTEETEQIPAACAHPGITVERGRIVNWSLSARNYEDPYKDFVLNCNDALAGRNCSGLRDEGFTLLDQGEFLDIVECDEGGNPHYKSLHSPFSLERHRLDFQSHEGDCTDVTKDIRYRLSIMANRVACDPETNEPYEDLTEGIGARSGGRVRVPGYGNLK
ncbi:MAG: hypothetical protein ABII07_05340 [Patescibacteria group bacterium]|nr:hypothetical protein [Patescibacteria group bacterium]